ncbi:MAG: hypothetical protein ABSG51_07375 [Terracidiphilus sp.]
MYWPFSSPSEKAPFKGTLEEKLDFLERIGFRLEEPFTAEDLLTSWSREEFEKPGFSLALVGLGMTEEQPPWRKHCANMWHFDTECIEDNGDYVRIAEQMKSLAQGSLPIEDIRDQVDIDRGIAWLEFSFRGELKHIDCRVKDDWVDGDVFSQFADLLAQSDPDKKFLYYDTDGQDCILACATNAQFKELKRAGIKFELLKGALIG